MRTSRALAGTVLVVTLVTGVTGCGGRFRDGAGAVPADSVPPADTAPAQPGGQAAARSVDPLVAASIESVAQQAEGVLSRGESAIAQDG